MHEYSLMRNLLKQVEQIRLEQGADSVREIRVELGAFAGVEPLLLATAFKQLATDPTNVQAELVIDKVGLKVQCERCEIEFDLDDFNFRCRSCGGNVKVVQGDRFQLSSVSLDCPDPHQETV